MSFDTTRLLLYVASLIGTCNSYDYILTLFRSNGSSYIVHKRCPAAGSLFAPGLLDDDLFGCHAFTQPVDACTDVSPPKQANDTHRLICLQFIALVERGNCSFAQKTYLAQEADFQAVVIYDNDFHTDLQPMSGDGIFDSKIDVPAFLISRTCGLYLQNFSFENGNMVMISRATVDFGKYMIPFVIVVGMCFTIAIVALTVKLIRDKRHELRIRLSRSNLKKIPTKKYKKNDIPETCPICLDDFNDGDRLRILPCSHWYHVKCVDPWLTKNRKLCPVCKRKVIKDDSDSASDDQSGQPTGGSHRPATSRASEERTPLITPDSPVGNRYGSLYSSYGSAEDLTFSQPASLLEHDDNQPNEYSANETHTPISAINRADPGSNDFVEPSPNESIVVEGAGRENRAFENEAEFRPTQSEVPASSAQDEQL